MGPSYFNTVDRLPNNLRNYIGGTNAGYSSAQQNTPAAMPFRSQHRPMTGMFGGYTPFNMWRNPFAVRSPFQFMPSIGYNWMMAPRPDYNAITQNMAQTPSTPPGLPPSPIPPVGGNPHLAPALPPPAAPMPPPTNNIGSGIGPQRHPIFGWTAAPPGDSGGGGR